MSADAVIRRHPCACVVTDGRAPCQHFAVPHLNVRVAQGEWWASENERHAAAEEARKAAEKCVACDGTGMVGQVVCRLCKRPDPGTAGPAPA